MKGARNATGAHAKAAAANATCAHGPWMRRCRCRWSYGECYRVTFDVLSRRRPQSPH